MIRVTQKFSCSHPPVGDGNPPPPVSVTTRGHSAVVESRECYCTGKAIPMKREVTSWEPDEERVQQ